MIDITRLVADEWSPHFWEEWQDGRWEPRTHGIIQAFVHGGTFVDLGAWVGPTAIWAAMAGASDIMCIEPDPVAWDMLSANLDVLMDTDGIDDTLFSLSLSREAVAAVNEPTTIAASGNSMSRTGDPNDVPVEGWTVENLIWRHCGDDPDVDLIKADTEGAEAEWFPQAEPFLRQLGAPILLSTHHWAPFPWECVGSGWTRMPVDRDEWLLVPENGYRMTQRFLDRMPLVG